jgi:hypothetical protein
VTILTKTHLNNKSNKFVLPEIVDDWHPEEIDLNEVVRSICYKYSIDQQKNFILRFDKLPIAGGNKDHFQCLFDGLIEMIVNHPPVNSKLFLYIKCTEQPGDAEIIDLRLTAETKLYKIDLYTNITTNEHWELLHKNKLNECSSLAIQNGGSISFSPISNTGCLFSLILSGKIN